MDPYNGHHEAGLMLPFHSLPFLTAHLPHEFLSCPQGHFILSDILLAAAMMLTHLPHSSQVVVTEENRLINSALQPSISLKINNHIGSIILMLKYIIVNVN